MIAVDMPSSDRRTCVRARYVDCDEGATIRVVMSGVGEREVQSCKRHVSAMLISINYQFRCRMTVTINDVVDGY